MISQFHIFQKLILPVVFLTTGFCIGQNVSFYEVQNFINASKLDSAEYSLNKIEHEIKNQYDQGLYYFYQGYISKRKDNHNLAFKSFLLAEKEFVAIDSIKDAADTYYEIYDLLTHQKNSATDPLPYLNKYISFAKKTKEPLYLARALVKIGDIHNFGNRLDSTMTNYQKSIAELQKINDTIRVALVKMNIATAFNSIPNSKGKKQPDSALYYLKNIEPILLQINQPNFLFVNYNNQGQAYKQKQDYSNAVIYLKKAESLNLNNYDKKTRKILYENLIDSYKKINDFENAFLYSEKLNQIKDSINETLQNISISDIKEEYDNEKLRADNLESEAKRKQNQNIAIGLGGGLLGITIIGFLLFKNTKRKQRIAEQEREIEIQKTEKLLKEQELTTIDAMIEGQEKERQRLASDLHDSVGATLSAARLQFEHLQKHKGSLQNEEELFSKTGELLEEAYQEVRSMAHIKNNGVIAKNGLLPAIEKLVKSVSVSNQLNIEVQDFGLTERIDNSLEITIFRIIQELVTNIIKHAQATEASISLTQFENTINIIVEDNGKGFNVRKSFNKEKGMGLSSIEKRVEHLEGSMEVDSTLGKGTNILIDIPI